MNSEKILLNMYKKQQYESTRSNIQGLVMLMSAAGMLIGTILTILLISNMTSFYLFTSVLFCIGIAYLLQKFKVVSRNTASIIYFIYTCFFFIPANWIVTGGLNGGTPFIAIIVMLALMMVFSGKTQQIIQICYLGVIAGLLIYSFLSAPLKEDFLNLLYKSVAFYIAAVFISFYMQYMLKKYDKMHNKFLNGSIKDELTQVLSRNVLDVVLSYTESVYKSNRIDYVMVMLDVDHFKKINDEYGHVVGDIVLRNTANCIKMHLREEDFVIRYGGDEFLAVLLNVSVQKAAGIFDRIDMEQQCKRLLDFNISVSRGCAVRSECSSTEEMIELADKRMYEHKTKRR